MYLKISRVFCSKSHVNDTWKRKRKRKSLHTLLHTCNESYTNNGNVAPSKLFVGATWAQMDICNIEWGSHERMYEHSRHRMMIHSSRASWRFYQHPVGSMGTHSWREWMNFEGERESRFISSKNSHERGVVEPGARWLVGNWGRVAHGPPYKGWRQIGGIVSPLPWIVPLEIVHHLDDRVKAPPKIKRHSRSRGSQ